MKASQLWIILIIIILCSILLINTFRLYELFDSRTQVLYIWKSGNSTSGKFSPYWNDLIKRVEKNKLNVIMCDVDIVNEPDLADYEKEKQKYDDDKNIPFVRIITSKGNRYDYNINDDYKYYYGGIGTYGDLSGYYASQKIYKMILDKKDA